MKQRRRIYYSAVQRSEIWDRWQAGESMVQSDVGLTGSPRSPAPANAVALYDDDHLILRVRERRPVRDAVPIQVSARPRWLTSPLP